MNTLLPTIGSAGDVHPMIGLGRTLQQRGHQVTVVANPLHEETVKGAGLFFEPLGTRAEAEALLANPDLWHPNRAFAVIVREAILPASRPLYEFIARQDPAQGLDARKARDEAATWIEQLAEQPRARSDERESSRGDI
ncbi:MAG: glycosyltransferase [Chloroflexota bacterium]|nr:glycosyltransferase [Chloroflexota bacterium]